MGEIGQIPSHQVKVDNWPLFFLQRLHHFYRKKSHCDLTLLFSTLDTVKSIKVHKLVLHACTDYFESLDIMKDSEHGEFLQLSNEMHPDVVIPIISFMYTGKLEFPVTLQPRLYEAATKLRMTILTKLLDVQPGKTSEKSAQQCFEEVSILQNNSINPVDCNQEGQNMTTVSAEISSSNITSPSPKTVEDHIITLTPVSPKSVTPHRKNLKPEVTIIQHSNTASEKSSCQKKIKSFKKNSGLPISSISTKPKAVDANLPPTSSGRILPLGKRKIPLIGSQTSENLQNVRTALRAADLPKPTRFEWDEDLNDPTVLSPVEDAQKILSHDGHAKITHPIILDGEGPKHKEFSCCDSSSKRSSDGSSSESPPFKKSRSDLQDMKEYGKQQQLRNEIICSEENLDDVTDADDLYGACDDEPELTNYNQSKVNCTTPKPILKTVSKPEPPMSSKRVRFSFEGKENNQQQNETSSGDFTSPKQTESTVSKQKIVLPMDVTQMQSDKHHVKIVSEVLKKFPNLAKRENIKLRVVSKNPAAVPPTVQKAVEGETGTGSKSASSLVSYIFLTNKGSGEIISVKNDSSDKDKGFDVENKTGPWFCHVCNEEDPLEFDSYYTYRRHLVEVHELKIDARICEYCGLKNSKRNHLLYHLYTKHGINPPPHISFPKCPECDYIALSDALLFKHKANHDPKGLMCYTCNVVFKTYSGMQLHLHSDWHRNKLKETMLADYPCPFCEARFENGNDLKDHMETSHHSQRISTNEGPKQIYRCPYCESLYGNADFLGKHIVSVHWGKDGKNVIKEDGIKEDVGQPQSGQQLQYASESEVTTDAESSENQTSSELESLNSVASGIATSLSLVGNEQTVVYYEQKTQEQDIGREATVVAEDECKEYIITDSFEDVNSKEPPITNETVEIIDVENEDSNSRASNTEDVNPTSCSDHDYSEPQMEENFRQVIPVHSVSGQIAESSVIQQIVPDQGLVFANQGNVVFQSPCVNLPQRVLLTSGKVVLPRVSGERNLILSQVIPQTQIILSGSILQQPSNIINEGNSTIVFANPEATQVENIQTVHYQIQTPENVESEIQEKLESNALQEESRQIVVKQVGNSVGVIKHVHEASGTRIVTLTKKEGENGSASNLNSVSDDFKTTNRVKTSKIVDDWDEMNENSQNVESRSDGPSRADFY